MPLPRSVLIPLIALAIAVAYRPVDAAGQPLTVVYQAPRKPAHGNRLCSSCCTALARTSKIWCRWPPGSIGVWR